MQCPISQFFLLARSPSGGDLIRTHLFGGPGSVSTADLDLLLIALA